MNSSSRRGAEAQRDEALDYPVDAPSDVEPVIYRSMILQSMAMQYFDYMRGSEEPFSMGEAFEAAQATWDTEWPADPAPRTIDVSKEVVDDDLSYWGEE